MRAGAIVALEGPSAAGKSTVALAAGALRGGATIPEAYVRLDRRVPLRFRAPEELLRIERRLLREDGRRWRRARDLARQGREVYLDTGILGTLTYTWGLVRLGRVDRAPLIALLGSIDRAARAGQIGLPDWTVFIDTPPTLRLRRARRSPEGHPIELDALHAQVGRLERALWLEQWGPLLGHRFARIDGSPSIPRLAHRLADIGSRATDRSASARARADHALIRRLLESLPTDGPPSVPGAW